MNEGADSPGNGPTAFSTGRPEPFTAVLRPHRSLSRGGFLALMCVLGTFGFAVGLGFFLAGAWPVVGFLGLDVALVYAAFRAYDRAASAEEHIVLSEGELVVRRIGTDGGDGAFTFNPYWVRLALMERPDGSNELSVSAHGHRLVIGGFLGARERARFARRLSAALASHKG